jgi:hypothetical protein
MSRFDADHCANGWGDVVDAVQQWRHGQGRMFPGPRRQVAGIEDLERAGLNLDAECCGFLFQRHATISDLGVSEVCTQYQAIGTARPDHVECRRPSALLSVAQLLLALRRRQVPRLELPRAVTGWDVLRSDGSTKSGVHAFVADTVSVGRRELPAVAVCRG